MSNWWKRRSARHAETNDQLAAMDAAYPGRLDRIERSTRRVSDPRPEDDERKLLEEVAGVPADCDCAGCANDEGCYWPQGEVGWAPWSADDLDPIELPPNVVQLVHKIVRDDDK